MYLLDKNQYHKALKALLSVSVNHLFARSVVEKHVSGIIYADDPLNPSAFHVVHPYGMSLLFGNTENAEFIRKLIDYMQNKNKERFKTEWMQAYPGKWNDIINEIIGDFLTAPDSKPEPGKIEVHTRANFRFSKGKYNLIRQKIQNGHLPVRMDRDLYEKMNGTVVPKNFWNNAEDFCKNGVGFTIVINNKPVCTAYSAYILDRQLELGIETTAECRGKGYALNACMALIDYCIENNYEPVWSCRLENTASYELARKLGFEPNLTLPYYRLPV